MKGFIEEARLLALLQVMSPLYGESANVGNAIAGKAKDSLAWVKIGSKKVETTLVGGYLTIDIKDSSIEQYDGVASISEG